MTANTRESQQPPVEARPRRAKKPAMRRPRTAAGDLWQGLKLHQLWRSLAFEEIASQYQRAALGWLWIGLSFLAFTFIFLVIFGRTSPIRSQWEYAAYFATGFMVFGFLSSNLTSGVRVFSSEAGWVKGAPAPFSLLVYKNLTRNLIEFAVTAAVTVPILAIAGWPSWGGLAMALLAVPIFILNAVWVQLLVGSIGAWSADFQQFVPAVMRVAFFATPIFWEYDLQDGRRKLLADLNPFTHFLELMRQPLLGGAPSLTNWAVVGGFTVVGWLVAFAVFRYARPRMAAWV